MDSRSIDDYLLNQMAESDREKFEERLLAENDLFYETADRENELVDAYVRGTLSDAARNQFEETLKSLPARRKKVYNARALLEFISAERTETKTITIAERSGLLAKLGGIYTFGSPAFQFASILLIVLFALAAAWLLMENRRLRSLETELAAAREREAELTLRVQTERDTADDLTADLSAERERITGLEQQIEALRRSVEGSSNEAPARPAPTIATLLLAPVSVRGGPPTPKRLEISEGVDRVAVSIVMEDGLPVTDPVTIKLNGETVASSAKIRRRGNQRSVSVTIPVSKLKAGRNEITLVAADGSAIVSYPFLLAEQR